VKVGEIGLVVVCTERVGPFGGWDLLALIEGNNLDFFDKLLGGDGDNPNYFVYILLFNLIIRITYKMLITDFY
jgi:hypothetical protein